MLRDSVVVVAVVGTRPRAIPLAMITMIKSTHGFPFLSHMSMGLRLATLWTAGAPLITIQKRGLITKAMTLRVIYRQKIIENRFKHLFICLSNNIKRRFYHFLSYVAKISTDGKESEQYHIEVFEKLF